MNNNLNELTDGTQTCESVSRLNLNIKQIIQKTRNAQCRASFMICILDL